MEKQCGWALGNDERPYDTPSSIDPHPSRALLCFEIYVALCHLFSLSDTDAYDFTALIHVFRLAPRPLNAFILMLCGLKPSPM